LRRVGAGEIPIIYMTASLRPELRDAAGDLGAVGFFEKPLNTAALLQTISRILPRTNHQATSRTI
jgi:CheY-like chemotaxis protein